MLIILYSRALTRRIQLSPKKKEQKKKSGKMKSDWKRNNLRLIIAILNFLFGVIF